MIATGDRAPTAEYWLQRATFTLIEARGPAHGAGRQTALAELRVARWPQTAACDDVLRAVDVAAPAFAGVITESLAYSTLQAGPEFARWLAERGPAHACPTSPIPLQAERDGDVLRVRFNRPRRHNAFSTDARAALLEALEVARLDPGITGWCSRATASPSAAEAISQSSARSPIRPARTWPAPGTARRWCSTRSPRGWVRPAAPRCTARCSAAGWRWRRSAGT